MLPTCIAKSWDFLRVLTRCTGTTLFHRLSSCARVIVYAAHSSLLKVLKLPAGTYCSEPPCVAAAATEMTRSALSTYRSADQHKSWANCEWSMPRRRLSSSRQSPLSCRSSSNGRCCTMRSNPMPHAHMLKRASFCMRLLSGLIYSILPWRKKNQLRPMLEEFNQLWLILHSTPRVRVRLCETAQHAVALNCTLWQGCATLGNHRDCTLHGTSHWVQRLSRPPAGSPRSPSRAARQGSAWPLALRHNIGNENQIHTLPST